jgi:putative ABC transport system permease protein
MFALELRGLLSRKMRTALTAVAIVLGVSLVAGTYILTDTINKSFDDVFATAAQGVDVAVVPKKAIDTQETATPAFSATILPKVRATQGVKFASGGVFNTATILDKNGDRVGAQGSSNFVASASPPPFSPIRYVDGRVPRTASEVAIDQGTADKQSWKVGDRVEVAGDTGRKSYTLTGIAKYGDVKSIGASIAIMTLPEAQRVLGEVGRFDEIDVVAAPGTTPEQLVTRLRGTLPTDVTVRTGAENARQQSKDVKDGFSFVNIILLVFAGVALFVGAFMIFNSLSITVAQRTREFAMLRTLGASRAQVLRSVLLEATFVGLLASLAGLALGFVMAKALRALFSAIGADLPSNGTVVETRTVVVSLLIGTVITLIASLSPALRATRVPPIAALREGAVLPRGRLSKLRTPISVVVLLLGAALIALGLVGGGGAAAVGAGAAVTMLAVALLARHVVKPLASAVGIPLEKLRGVTGRLARENATRNPGRTATTAAALMIGLALVTFVSILAAGIKDTIASSVDKGFNGAFVVQNTDGFSNIPTGIEPTLQRVPGVGTIVAARFSQGKVEGIKGNQGVSGIDTRKVDSIYEVDWKKGGPETLTSLGPDDAVVSDKWAKDKGVKVGETLTVLTPSNKTVRLTVKGTYTDDAQLFSDITVPNPTLVSQFGQRDPGAFLLGLTAGANEKVVKARAQTVLKDRYPSAELLTKKEFTDNIAGQITQILFLIYVLLSLSVIVSLFGIVNTLALSIFERTRELGMLRAIGLSRSQVRRMVRYESVITAMIGAVLGVILGIAFALAMAPVLQDEGLGIKIPVVTLIVLFILAGVAGVLAAILPARRAARLDVLESLAYE